MVLMFGVDIPLLQVILVFTVISIILLIEIIVVMLMLMKQAGHSKQKQELLKQMMDTLLEIKDKEIEELAQLRRLKK